MVFQSISTLLDRLTQKLQLIEMKGKAVKETGNFEPLAYGGSRPVVHVDPADKQRKIDTTLRDSQFNRLKELHTEANKLNLSVQGCTLATILAEMAYLTAFEPTYVGNPKSMIPIVPRTSPKDVLNRLDPTERDMFTNAIDSNLKNEDTAALRAFLFKYGDVLACGDATVPDIAPSTYQTWLAATTGVGARVQWR